MVVFKLGLYHVILRRGKQKRNGGWQTSTEMDLMVEICPCILWILLECRNVYKEIFYGVILMELQ
jgi:hypothetical protein